LLSTWAEAAVLQTVPQAPQLFGSVVLSASQPLYLLLSQLKYVPEHSGEHWLFAHVFMLTCALGAVEQAIPQPPQLPGLDVVSVSQPSPMPPEQSP
jgi:hypothetical protein